MVAVVRSFFNVSEEGRGVTGVRFDTGGPRVLTPTGTIPALVVNFLQKCSQGHFNAVSQYLWRLSLRPQNAPPAPEISQIEPWQCERERVGNTV